MEKRAPYYLLIHTNAYTGNFERELVSYCFGILDKEQEDHSKEYKKAFWNSVVGRGIDSYEEYLNSEIKKICDSSTDLLSGLDEFQKFLNSGEDVDLDSFLVSFKEKRALERYQKDICRLYDTYLCDTWQTVDDWEQNIFYNIDSFYKNKKYNCDTIFVQLNKPLPEHLEEIVIERIKQFFEQDAYNVIQDYIWLCSFGETRKGKEELKLLDLELVDSKNNLVKKYV